MSASELNLAQRGDWKERPSLSPMRPNRSKTRQIPSFAKASMLNTPPRRRTRRASLDYSSPQISTEMHLSDLDTTVPPEDDDF